MSEKTPAEKLRLKPGMTAALLHVPEGIEKVLGIPAGVARVQNPGAADFVLEFAATQAEAEERLAALKSAIGEETLAWLAYPKGSKAAGHDLSRDTVWQFARTIGLALIANVSIDDTWSALRMRPAKPGE